MIKAFPSAICLLLLISCGKPNDVKEDNFNSDYGSVFKGGSAITDAQSQSVAQICQAFTVKRKKFEKLQDSATSFAYQVKSKDCYDQEENVSSVRAYLSIRARSNFYLYANSRTRFMGDVYTDEYDYFEGLCSQQLKMDYIDYNGGKLAFKFNNTNNQALKNIELHIFEKHSDGKERKSHGEILEINVNSRDDNFGHVVKRIRQEKCTLSTQLNSHDNYRHIRI